MSDASKIEWTDATWNPVSGCSKVSQGCKYCYAERIWPKVAGAEAKRTGQPSRAFTDVRCHPDRLEHPLRWRAPKRIFVNSMSDLFHADVPFDFVDQVFAVMALAHQHNFQILTKRPERMRVYFTDRPNAPTGRRNFIIPHFSRLARNDDVQGFSLPLQNVWLGVSVEDQAAADERIPMLLQTPAAIRFVSYEPALGPVRFDRYFEFETDNNGPILPGINWLIAGGESGPDARPSHPDWFRSARDQCAAAGVAFFFKQWGEWRDDMDFVREKNLWDETRIRCSDATKIEGHPELFVKVGKKPAGRLLDGCTWNDYPA